MATARRLDGPDRDPADFAAAEQRLALEFGNDAAAGPKGTLFFAAGPNDERRLFGTIAPSP